MDKKTRSESEKTKHLNTLILDLQANIRNLDNDSIAQELEVIRAIVNTPVYEVKKEGPNTYRLIT
tara:strand:+ start:91 stop:285 length:195 start_codon:yes stop_codon:yes gene_type:complete